MGPIMRHTTASASTTRSTMTHLPEPVTAHLTPTDINDCFDLADLPGERWLPVPGLEGLYEVSSLGRVKSLERMAPRRSKNGEPMAPKPVRARIIRPGTDPKGYRKTVLSDRGHTKAFRIHKMVLETFVGPCPPGHESRHRNGIPDDNRVANLEWGTPSQNTHDRVRHGTHFQARRTMCKWGHPLVGANLGRWEHGQAVKRQCRSCHKAGNRFSRKTQHLEFRRCADDHCASLLGDDWREQYRPGPKDAPPQNPTSWASSEAARRTMLSNRASDTLPELTLRRELRAVGLVGYRLQWPVPGAPRRSIDIAFVKQRVAVLVDGCFWHGCPQHPSEPERNADYWTAKLARNIERDHETNALLRSAGWTVLRFWSHEDPADCARSVLVALDPSLAKTVPCGHEALDGGPPPDQLPDQDPSGMTSAPRKD